MQPDVEDIIASTRQKGRGLSRWGLLDGDTPMTLERWKLLGGDEGWSGPKQNGVWDAVCYASLYNSLCPPAHNSDQPVGFWSVFNGHTTNATGIYRHSSGDGAAPSTKESLRWIEYLLGEESPWVGLHPWLASTDLEWVNQHGVVFSDVKQMPTKLLFNFLQAWRKPFEYPGMFQLWLDLREEGFNPRQADFLTCALVPTNYADSYKAEKWTVSPSWSGHVHLHDDSPWKYYHRYCHADPDKKKLKMVFSTVHDNPGHNTNIWAGKTPKYHDRHYARTEFAVFLSNLEKENVDAA